MASFIDVAENMRPILGAIKVVPVPPRAGAQPPPPAEPFITLSREPGAGAWSLAQQLVQCLNADDPAGRPWTAWDRELMEKVARDYHLSTQLIDSLEEANHSWLTEFLSGLSSADVPEQADEARIYGRMVATIRALAQAGRVVIVGAGSVFVTRPMPGGIHVRLVAPLEKRIEFMAHTCNMTPKAAAARIKEMEHNRQVFFRRYWPKEAIAPESFALTINTATLSTETIIDLLKTVVRHAVPAPAAR